MDRLNLRRVSVDITGIHSIGQSTTINIKSGCESNLDVNPILTAINETLTEQPKAVDDYRKGKKGAFNFLIGQLMKKTRGCADPAELNRLLLEELKKQEP
jgi:Asp-tRNA(Asn)/Glu-tRNA(Gln) amidotransferase B subunit